RGQAHGWLHVIGEDQEPRAKAANFGQRDAVQDRTHRMLADTEMQIATARTLRLEIAGTLECKVRFRRWRKISRAADQPGIPRGDGIEYLARGVAAGDPLGVCGKRREAAVPTIGELAPLHALHLLGELRVLPSIRSEQRRPRVANATT